MTTSPAPLQSLLGGFGISLAVHELLVLNGNTFGISGFLHRAIRGNLEGLAGVVGLVLSGILVATVEGKGPAPLNNSLPQVLLAGCLVGLGTKVRIITLPHSLIRSQTSCTARQWLHVWVRRPYQNYMSC